MNEQTEQTSIYQPLSTRDDAIYTIIDTARCLVDASIETEIVNAGQSETIIIIRPTLDTDAPKLIGSGGSVAQTISKMAKFMSGRLRHRLSVRIDA